MGFLDTKKVFYKKGGGQRGDVDPNIKKNDAKMLSLLRFYNNKKIWRKYGGNLNVS